MCAEQKEYVDYETTYQLKPHSSAFEKVSPLETNFFKITSSQVLQNQEYSGT
jgi:hypothetical protein